MTEAATASRDLSNIKAAIDALPVTFDAVTSVWASRMTNRTQSVEHGQQGVRASALRDIEEFEKKDPEDQSASAWIATARAKYFGGCKEFETSLRHFVTIVKEPQPVAFRGFCHPSSRLLRPTSPKTGPTVLFGLGVRYAL
jgi:hypothetical protein